MTQYTIEYDQAELKKLADNFAKGMTTAALPNTDAAFQRASQMVRQMWVGFLEGSVQLPGVETPDRVTSAMVKSIKTQDKTTADDIEDWDSLEHINLVVAIENKFGIKCKY